MADKKKRQPNFTETELLSLITAVAEKKIVLFAKFNGNITAKSKLMAWQYVTDAVNSVSVVKRECSDVRKKFTDLKTVVKKKAAEEKKYNNGTGEHAIKYMNLFWHYCYCLI